MVGSMDGLIKVKNFITDCVINSSEYILALFILLECNSVYTMVADRYNQVYIMQQYMFMYGHVLAAVLIIRHKFSFERVLKGLAVLIPAGVLLFVYYKLAMVQTIARVDYERTFFHFFPLMVLIFVIHRDSDEPYRIFCKISDVMIFLSVSSLIAWIFMQFIGDNRLFGHLTIDWGARKDVVNIGNLGFFWSKDWTFIKDGSLYRNTGIYPESPMYNIGLCLSLATELFLKNRTPAIRAGILTVAILSTTGTLGILIMIGAWVLKAAAGVRNQKLARRVLSILIMAFSVVALLIVLRKKAEDPNSFNNHLGDYIGCVRCFLDKPLAGCGWNLSELICPYFVPPRERANLANSVAGVLAEGGILLFSFYLIPFVILWYIGGWRKQRGAAQWSLIAFAIYCVTVFFTRFFMITILAFGYAQVIVCMDQKNKISVASAERRPTGRDCFYFDKLTIIYAAVTVAISLFLIRTSWLKENGLMLEDTQWAFVSLAFYSMLGIGVLKYVLDWKFPIPEAPEGVTLTAATVVPETRDAAEAETNSAVPKTNGTGKPKLSKKKGKKK